MVMKTQQLYNTKTFSLTIIIPVRRGHSDGFNSHLLKVATLNTYNSFQKTVDTNMLMEIAKKWLSIMQILAMYFRKEGTKKQSLGGM